MKDLDKILRMMKWVLRLTALGVYSYSLLKKSTEALSSFLVIVFMPVIVLVAGHVLFAGLILNSLQGMFRSGIDQYKKQTNAFKKFFHWLAKEKLIRDGKTLSIHGFFKKYCPMFLPFALGYKLKTQKS